jgi:hypothetical protein
VRGKQAGQRLRAALWDENTNKYRAIKLVLAFDLATTKGSKHAAAVLTRLVRTKGSDIELIRIGFVGLRNLGRFQTLEVFK